MDSSEIRKRYLDFFKERGHAVIPSSSLVPENDPTTLFTGSGMQPLLPYLLGEKHPKGIRLVNSQKCFRSMDIEEVGDNRHTTFFEMLGNWSLGNYFKEEQLSWFFEFLTKEVGLKPERLYVTVFSGGYGIGKDDESILIWKKLFGEHSINAEYAEMNTEEEGARRGMKGDELIFGYRDKNWWSRAGTPEKMPAGEPGGQDSEVFYEFTQIEHDKKFGEHCHPNCDCGRFMEIGNSVFMEYLKQKDESFMPLQQKNVDFGGGLERIVAASINNPDVFDIDILVPVIEIIDWRRRDQLHRAFKYIPDALQNQKEWVRRNRILADHLRAGMFLISDGVLPGNKERGYVLRRLLRRTMGEESIEEYVGLIFDSFEKQYKNVYPGLSSTKAKEVYAKEFSGFHENAKKGFAEIFKRYVATDASSIPKGIINGKDAFYYFSTFGIPRETFLDSVRDSIKLGSFELSSSFDIEYRTKYEEHQKASRLGAEQKFKGGLADGGAETTKLHTATHLMLAGLRKHLGNHVHQAGSNVTAERARFDFTHPEKVGRETLDKVEQYVNDAIAAGAERILEEMPKEEAKAAGIEGSFWEKYPDVVSVYTFKDTNGTVWSQELCGGPHVLNTRELGEPSSPSTSLRAKFKILKEEAVSAGVRRVKAALA